MVNAFLAQKCRSVFIFNSLRWGNIYKLNTIELRTIDIKMRNVYKETS